MTDPAEIIAGLNLAPHPEGGWYRQTWCAEAADGERPTATLIYFLLEAHQRSHWHRVDAAELWFWHAGAPITLSTAPHDTGPVTRTLLGARVLAGEAAQALVPAGHWQAAEPTDGWALVSCVVSPGFHFGGFELAPPGWSPGEPVQQ
ncbi:cupin domain-containing protein [Novosphingobium sp. BL-8A]|uniref:cupin domain-containing protein n=1 Tax=Novosphingobium sp. BL-8A TaxID=3127639 RepID=UPI0037569166